MPATAPIPNLNQFHDGARRVAVAIETVLEAYKTAESALRSAIPLLSDAAELARTCESLRIECLTKDRQIGEVTAEKNMYATQLQSAQGVARAVEKRNSELENQLTAQGREHQQTVQNLAKELAVAQAAKSEAMEAWTARGERISQLERDLADAVSKVSTRTNAILQMRTNMARNGASAAELSVIDAVLQL